MIKLVFLSSIIGVLPEDFFKKEIFKLNWQTSYFKNYNSYDLFYQKTFLSFFKIYLFLFLAALGLRCCARAFSSCREHGLLFVAVRGLTAVASLVAEHRLQARGLSSCGLRTVEHRLSSCGAQAQLLCGMWDLPGSGLKPVSPALAGGFLTTAPPGKSP